MALIWFSLVGPNINRIWDQDVIIKGHSRGAGARRVSRVIGEVQPCALGKLLTKPLLRYLIQALARVL